MFKGFLSVCLLSYKRLDMLSECMRSLKDNADVRYQLIVNSDGGDDTRDFLMHHYHKGNISNLILNNGENRGVGKSLSNCLTLAEGEYVVKVDSDLYFRPGWMSTGIKALYENPDVGSISFFNYRNYDPNDTRFHIELERDHCNIVNDFVSSIYMFRNESIKDIQPTQDDGNHNKLGLLAITKTDLVKNVGFGVGKSVYVSGTMEHPYKTPTHSFPYLLR